MAQVLMGCCPDNFIVGLEGFACGPHYILGLCVKSWSYLRMLRNGGPDTIHYCKLFITRGVSLERSHENETLDTIKHTAIVVSLLIGALKAATDAG